MYGYEAHNSHGQQKSTAIYVNTNIGDGLRTTKEEMASGNTPEAKGYDTKHEESDGKRNERSKKDTNIKEEIISDVSIRDLHQVIRDKRRNEYNGFKREYAVSEDISCNFQL